MHRAQTGLSIIEVLVAIAVLATVSAALLPAIALCARLQRESGVEVQAALIASRRLEALKAGLAAGPVASGAEFVDRRGDAIAIPLAVFDCRWQVEPAPGAPGLLRVVVRVAAIGDAAAVTISTVVPGG